MKTLKAILHFLTHGIELKEGKKYVILNSNIYSLKLKL